jgi:hypothetical protein
MDSLKVQRAISGIKTQWLVVLFISLESSWNSDVSNESHCSFGHLKHKLWPKQGPRVIKSRESTRFTYLQNATYRWKALNESYNFAFDHTLIRGLLAKLWGSKVVGLPTWAISGLPLGSPKTKSHLDVGSMASHRIYYKGEGGGFPQVRAMVNLVCLCCSWLILAPKVLKLRTNHLVVVLCRLVWVSEACQLFLVPSQNSSMLLYPSKCCEPRSVLRLLPFSLFSTWTHIWVSQGVGSASDPKIEHLYEGPNIQARGKGINKVGPYN